MSQDTDKIGKCFERLEKGFGRDRDLDWDIAEALGGSIRRVTSLGLNGRTPGTYRVFWPHTDPFGRGAQIPYYTKHRDKAKAKLAAYRLSLAERGGDGPVEIGDIS